MKRLLLLCLLPASLLAITGCSSGPKLDPHVATSVEEGFKQRWIAKRMAELQASGQAPDPRDARKIATDEFKQQYAYTTVARRPDPVGGGLLP